MIRKQLPKIILLLLTLLSAGPTVESQEIRLEPPQLDRQGIIRNVRPGAQRMGQSSKILRSDQVQRGGYLQRSIPRLGVARVARQEPIGRTAARGIYDLATLRQQEAAGNKQNNAASDGIEVIPGDVYPGDEVMIDESGMMIDGGFCPDPCIVCPPYQIVSFADMEYTAGVQGFKGVPNLGESGSFGFNEGINWGFPAPILPILGMSGQIGFRFTQADFYGANMTDDSRHQAFLTAGISRRVDYGFQMGVVFDYLEDSWYYDGSFAQVRSEFAWVGGCGNRLGFRYISGVQDSTEEVAEGLASIGRNPVFDFSPVNTYRFFYRQQWDQARGGHAELMGGFTENGDGMFGTEFLIPIAESWALTSDFTCLLPSSEDPALQRIDESWNVGLGLTWYPKGLSTWSKLYHRPLLDVADNGTFMFQR